MNNNQIPSIMNESPKTPDCGNPHACKCMWKELLLITLGAALAILLTFGTAAWVKHCRMEKNHKQTALVAISDIKGFSDQLQSINNEFFTPWKNDIEELRAMPREKILKLSDEELEKYWEAVEVPLVLPYGNIAETYFTNAIADWHGANDFQFIKKVGAAYSYMDDIRKNFKVMMDKKGEVMDNFEMNYDWKRVSRAEKLAAYLQNKEADHFMDDFCEGFSPYIEYVIEELNKYVTKCQELAGISTDELNAFLAANN